MKIGVTLRNMGPQSSASVMAGGARMAEAAGFESVWITDHLAIPPDDAEGSGGRYTDPLVTLGWLAGQTTRIMLGAGVLIVPYRPALPVAKQIATIQELSADRLLLGVGVGWMAAEFKALGIPRQTRGQVTDETLDFWRRCFSQTVVEPHGQPILFEPKPTKPPFLVGGAAPHALKRAVLHGDGWLPMVNFARDGALAKLAADMAQLEAYCSQYGRNRSELSVTVMGALPADGQIAQQTLSTLQEIGVARLVCAVRYDNLEDYQRGLEHLGEVCQTLISG